MPDLIYEFPEVSPNSKLYGLRDGGTQQFKAGFMYHLTREALQNIMDAGLENGLPARAEFNLEQWEAGDFPERSGLLKILANCADSQKEDENIGQFCKGAEKLLKKKTIPFLVIRDFNTKGLNGGDNERTGNYFRLLKSEGSSSKNESKAGSYGLGKNAFYAASDLRCFFVSSVFIDDTNNAKKYVFQGCLKYSTFIEKKGKAGIWHQPDGYFGSAGFFAARNKNMIPGKFARSEQGTSLFIPGFIGAEEDWKEQIIKATLENFWLAIIQGKISVKIDDQEITEENIKEIIESRYKIGDDDTGDLQSNPLPQLLAYTGKEGMEGWQVFPGKIEGLGKVRLFLLLNDAFSKRVHYYRVGMKIWKKGHTKLSIPYVGVFVCDDEGGEKLLRKMENPAHDKWDPGNIERDEELKAKAASVLAGIDKFVKASLGSIGVPAKGEAIELPNLPSFLSIEKQGVKESETGGLSGTPKLINIPKPVNTGPIIKRDPPPPPPPGPGPGPKPTGLGKLLRDFPVPRAFAVSDDAYRIIVRGEPGAKIALRLFSSSDNGFEKMALVRATQTEAEKEYECDGNLVRHLALPSGGELKVDVMVQNSFMAPLFIQTYED